jgi:CHAD domain-containing protein
MLSPPAAAQATMIDASSKRVPDVAQAGDAPSAERAQPIALESHISARAAFEIIARSCVRQLRANEACARSAQDPEGVHQFRVGLRRMRALIGSYRRHLAPDFTGYLTAELDWLQTRCGPARDWDVLAIGTLQPLSKALPADRTIPSMLKEAAAARDESYAVVRSTLDGPRYAELISRLEPALTDGKWSASALCAGTLMDRPACEVARVILKSRHKKLPQLPSAPTMDELHELRIAVKKLRYAAEFFRSLYGKSRAARFIAALENLQDCLGTINDAVMGQQLAIVLEARLVERTDRATASHASGLLLGWHAQQIDCALREFQRCWPELQRAPAFWKKNDAR